MEKDFFISYNKADGQWAKWVAGTLEEYGYKTIIQAWDFKPGNNFVLEMQKAILSCRRTILILSQSYLESEYCQAEWASIFNYDPTGKRAELIPIRVADVKPEGLLSSIIYIDLFEQQEDVAIKKLLNGVGYSENPRKKSEFPVGQNNGNSGKQLKNDNKVQFLFDLEEDNSVDKFPISTKNNLREWYYSNHKSRFNVVINDKRKTSISVHMNEINMKLKQHDLTIKEEVEYQNYIRALRKCEHESQLKEKAIEFFLKDDGLQAYLCINNYLELLDIVKSILEYDYYDQQKHGNNQYVQLDVFLDPAPEECHEHFVVCIEKEKIDKQLGGHSQYDLFGLYVIDLGRNIIKDIVVGYYLFLSEEILDYNNVQLIHNKKVMNLLTYRAGLH